MFDISSETRAAIRAFRATQRDLFAGTKFSRAMWARIRSECEAAGFPEPMARAAFHAIEDGESGLNQAAATAWADAARRAIQTAAAH